MSSPVAVKCEDLQTQTAHDDFHVSTEESDTDDASIDIDSLQLLDAKFASKSKFPVGSTVWYDAKKSKVTKMLRAMSGCVVGVYFDLQCMRHVYKVKSSSDIEHAVTEDRLMYGINCPVQVTNHDTNATVDGVIVVPKIEQTINGKQQVTYVVQYTEGGNVSVEFRVAADRVKYREDDEKPNRSDCIDKGDTTMEEPKTKGNSNGVEAEKSIGQISAKTEEDGLTQSIEAENDLQHTSFIEEKSLQSSAISTHPPLPKRKRIKRKRKQAATSKSPTHPVKKKNECSSNLSTSRWEPPSPDKSVLSKGKDRQLSQEKASPPFQRKRNLELKYESEGRGELSKHPRKMIKTESAENESKGQGNVLTCTLIIPKWVYYIRNRAKHALFYHLIGHSAGSKMKRIESTSSCNVQIPSMDHPMKINITSNSIGNIASCIGMLEKSLIAFLSDKNAVNKMLFELISTAEGSQLVRRSSLIVRTDGSRMVLREYDGENYWSTLIELPFVPREDVEGKEYRALLTNTKGSNCTIELYGDKISLPLRHTSPYLLIRSKKLKDVRDAVNVIRSAMKLNSKVDQVGAL